MAEMVEFVADFGNATIGHCGEVVRTYDNGQVDVLLTHRSPACTEVRPSFVVLNVDRSDLKPCPCQPAS